MGELVSLDGWRRRRHGVASPESPVTLAVPDGVRASLRVQGFPSESLCDGCRQQLGAQWFVVGNLPGVFCSLACAETLMDAR